VAFKPGTVAVERLPLPIVLYPGFYGAFFAFKSDPVSEPVFCSCAFEAIENYIRLRMLRPIPQNAYPDRMFILGSTHFPQSVVDDLMKKGFTSDTVLSGLRFQEKLCHECNLQTPTFRYCVEMYGGAFKQNYGWYINKQALEWGVLPPWDEFLPDAVPEELKMLLANEERSHSVQKELLRTKFSERSDFATLYKEIRKDHRKIWNIIENEVRRKFGHKAVGEAWTSETILYYIVKKLFPNFSVLRHYRPDFLGGLEIDIYIEELKVGIEYQGIQHFRPVKHWGGEEAFRELKKRDKKKKTICASREIPLVFFEYGEGLSDAFVLNRLKPYLA
jgi:hypothetical protein